MPNVYGGPEQAQFGQKGGPRYSDLVSLPGDPPPPPVPPAPLVGDQDPAVAQPAPRKSRRALVLSLVIVAVVFLLAVAGTGVVVFLNNAGDTTFPVNSCVKQDGAEAVKTSCSTSGAFTVVSKVDRQEDCPDQNQPFIVVQHKGAKDQVLCLRPTSGK
jgi:hypothetical protein